MCPQTTYVLSTFGIQNTVSAAQQAGPLHNSSNICIPSWSWNYRSCWHQTCPPLDTHCYVWIAFIAESHPPHRVSRAAMARHCLARPVSAVDNFRGPASRAASHKQAVKSVCTHQN